MTSELVRLVPNSSGTRYNVEDQSEIPTSGARTQTEVKDASQTCMGNWFKSLVFGGFDGICTILIIISATAGGDIEWQFTVLLGISYIATNSLYIGVSEYLSAKAHREFLSAEKRRATWEFKHFREAEVNNMIESLESRGMARKDAEIVVQKMALYESIFVGQMVSEELGCSLPKEGEDARLITDSFMLFLSYSLFGAIPLIVLILAHENFQTNDLYLLTAGVAIGLLFILGVIKSVFSSSHWFYCGFEGLVLGVVSAIVAYYIGSVVKQVLLF